MVHFHTGLLKEQFQHFVGFVTRQLNFSSRAIIVSSLLALTCVSAVKRLTLFQYLEVTSFDMQTRLRPYQPIDDRLLLIEITESDLEAHGWPLSDEIVATVIANLQRYDPAVVGVDLYRNTPQPPGKAALDQEFQADNVIGIMNVGTSADGNEVPAAQALPANRVGFNDLAIDPDGVLRRNLLFVGTAETPYYSFPLRIALAYHNDLPFEIDPDNDQLRLGKTTFPALQAGNGGYSNVDNRGYQVLMRYRSPLPIARSLTVTDVLEGAVPPDWVKGKIILIGSTASSLKDEFFTPYSLDQSSEFMMAGVEVHAQSVSQILDAIDGKPAIFHFLPQWGEFIWILLWTVGAGTLGWKIRRPANLLIISSVIIISIWATGWIALTQFFWIPVIEPIASFFLALGLVIAQKALYRSTYDQLTLLPSRDVFLIQVERELQHQRELTSPVPVAVVFLDVDRFKLINQSFSHTAGDRVLQILTKRLLTTLPESAHLARVGGDEFAFMLRVYDRASVDQQLNQLQTKLAEPIDVAKQQLSISSSMGVVLAQAGGNFKPEDLLRDAHTAMYRAKALNEYRYEIFATTMHEEAVQRLQLESHLLKAFENEEFLLHYQPIVCLQTGKITGFEALVRWYRHDQGFVSPDKFIHIVEETGLIIHLGQWIFREACHQLRAWQEQFHRHDLRMSINLSRRQFHQVDLVEQFAATLAESGLSGSQIQLEITESMIMRDVEGAQQLMQRLKDLGLNLAIDDFGTGYSSLSYLHKFPTDTLKIDRSFVGHMDASQEDREIVQTIITLGQKLGMNLVAEGIEAIEQLTLLRDLGCQWGQGYYFSKPLDGEAATMLLNSPKDWRSDLLNVT
jgi:diguanylate cyclase (GGDEF)-like protein